MITQIWWRFQLKSLDWPYRIFRACSDSSTAFADTAWSLFESKLCCLDANVAYKCRHVWRNAQEMMRDHAFLEHLKQVQSSMKITNMHMERLLARLKKAAPGKHPLAERYVAAGTLAQHLHRHIQAGGRHPSTMKAADLIAAGVPLASASSLVRDGRKSRANIRYMTDKYAAIKKDRHAAGYPVHRSEFRRTPPSPHTLL